MQPDQAAMPHQHASTALPDQATLVCLSVKVAGGIVLLAEVGGDNGAAAKAAAVEDALRRDGAVLVSKLNEDLADAARLRLGRVGHRPRDEHIHDRAKLPHTNPSDTPLELP